MSGEKFKETEFNGIVLEVEELTTIFESSYGNIVAIKDVSLSLSKGEIVAVVGGSGSGKSTLAYSILNLISSPGRICSGKIKLGGKDLLQMNEDQLSPLRGRDISLVMQNPMSSFNPLLTVGYQFVETLRSHGNFTRKEAYAVAVKCLETMRLEEPEFMLCKFPFQLSGGMLQRIMIAMALCLKPSVLIADEPTTGLDVTLQAEILKLLRRLKVEGTAILLITHDLSVAAQMADRIAVMHNGRIVELRSAIEMFEHPAHPYTQELIIHGIAVSDGAWSMRGV